MLIRDAWGGLFGGLIAAWLLASVWVGRPAPMYLYRAFVLAKVGRLVFGAYDDKGGMCGSVGDVVRHPALNHRVEVIGGMEEARCGQLLADFFRAKR